MSPQYKHLFLVALGLIATPLANAKEPAITYYDVSGRTADQLRVQINALRPRDKGGNRHDALTEYSISYSYSSMSTPSGCRVAEFTPDVSISITLPRWVDADPASRLGKRWLAYYDALYKHELGHVDIALRAYNEISSSFAGHESSQSCALMGEELSGMFDTMMQTAKHENVSFDKETDHGKNLGATFP